MTRLMRNIGARIGIMSIGTTAGASATSSSTVFAGANTRHSPRARRATLLLAALATIVGMLAAPGTASAGDGNFTTACLGHSVLAGPVAVTRPTSSLPWGYVRYCWDGLNNFAQFIHVDANGRQAPMPANFIANAWIWRYEDYPNGFSENRPVMALAATAMWCREKSGVVATGFAIPVRAPDSAPRLSLSNGMDGSGSSSPVAGQILRDSVRRTHSVVA